MDLEVGQCCVGFGEGLGEWFGEGFVFGWLFEGGCVGEAVDCYVG